MYPPRRVVHYICTLKEALGIRPAPARLHRSDGRKERNETMDYCFKQYNPGLWLYLYYESAETWSEKSKSFKGGNFKINAGIF